MPRARKKKSDSPATKPVAVAEVLADSPVSEPIEHEKTENPAVAAFKAQREREHALSEPVPANDNINVAINGQAAESAPGKHAAAVLASRPKMQPAPAGYRPGPVFPPAGIRVNRGVERWNFGTTGIQFAEDRKLSRGDEYDLMTKLQDAGFQYQSTTRQWERKLPEGMAPGDNTLLAVELAREIATARNEGRGR